MNDIVIKDLCKAYGDNKVLNDVSVTFKAGEISTVMAPSGVGKTTLLRILVGLETADSGSIDGIDKKRLSAVFQEDRLCENLSAFTNIKFVTDREDEEILSALVALGLSGFEHHPVSSLSGGMKRRVAIIRALLADYDVLLLDEPFKGLDTATKQTVIDYTKQQTVGKTVILITHIREESEALGSSQIFEL